MTHPYNVKTVADTAIKRLTDRIECLKQCLDILDNPAVKDTTPIWACDRRVNLTHQLKMAERRIKALRIAAAEVQTTGLESMMELLTEDLEDMAKRLTELDPIVEGPDLDHRKWDEAHTEWYRLNLQVLYLTIAKEVIAADEAE